MRVRDASDMRLSKTSSMTSTEEKLFGPHLPLDFLSHCKLFYTEARLFEGFEFPFPREDCGISTWS